MYSIHWRGPLFHGSGYSFVMREYTRAMIEAGWDTQLSNVVYTLDDVSKYIPQEEIEFYKPYIKNRINKAHGSDRIFINHATPDLVEPFPYFRKSGACSMWETNTISEKSALKCNTMDFLITASEFSKSAFLTGGTKVPVHVVPHIVTPKDFTDVKYNNEKLEEITKDKLTFLSAFEWHKGKGYEELIKGFVEAFKEDDGVLLILKVNSLVDSKNLKWKVLEYIKSVKGNLKYPSILPICQPVQSDFLYSLYKYSDVFVSLSKREAFSLCASDGIVNNLLVMAPDRGGHRQFLTSENCVLINSDWDEVTPDKVEPERRNYIGQYWIQPNLEDFIKKLHIVRESWTNPSREDLEDLKNEANKVIEYLSPKNVLNEFDKIFREL